MIEFKKDPVKVRPHHILCLNAFIGMGYSKSFVKNMQMKIEHIERDNSLEIVFKADEICLKCPNLISDNFCNSQEKILELDTKVIKEFKLEERVYNFNELLTSLNSLTKDVHHNICCNCSWYNSSNCFAQIKKNINTLLK